ncbi:MAG: T9SS type A sorting domain-containing protein [Clostridia bacterium]|nr:T9SS type A sorting domain-containing protein [Clostridia bacterium]
MLGLSPYDSNADINIYKIQYGVSNPCAGPEGNAPEAIAKIIDGQIFMGYPTYCVVCPDKKLKFGVCSPPSVECFASIISNCGATDINEPATAGSGQLSVYPNPAQDFVVIRWDEPEAINLKLIRLADGAIIRNQPLGLSTTSASISLSDVAPGLYLVQLTTLQGIVTQKLSVVK